MDRDFRKAGDLELSLRRRGPDATGQVVIQNTCILGNTRLAIIDLEGSIQPMQCNCGIHYLTFNGEIFNYKSIRENLDYVFKTEGDTETLLALICSEGFSALNKVRGQFAMAVWNSKTEELSLAVDYFGILPLYVSSTSSHLIFSSSTTFLGNALKKVDDETLRTLLKSRAINAPETAYEGVERIVPGEIWTYSKTCIDRKSWVKEDLEQKVIKPDTYRLKTLLNQAADRIITADVEVGVFLSGGIDSAVVAQLAQDRLPYQLRAYTAVWPGKTKEDEGESARHTARRLGLKHIELEVNPQEWWRGMLSGTALRDGPMSEPADSVFYLLSERASQDVKVVCTGEGADELFSGYAKNKIEILSANALARFSLHLVGTKLKTILSESQERAIHAASQEVASSRYASYFGTFWNDASFATPMDLHNADLYSGIEGLRRWDLKHYLPSILLDRGDRMAMANSLENRPLFLDIDLANYARGIGADEFATIFRTKRLFRIAAQEILPFNIAKMKKKGFPLPLSQWMQTELYDLVCGILLDEPSKFEEIIPRNRIELMLYEHRSGNRNHTLRLFTLLSLTMWLMNS